ncbi:MAG: GlxA family transcriptional regulator [Kordiimonadaceae bacterium]|nr:GlxA family transcriptional regulator [Kordiimonadaceae bacterium]
MDALKEHTVAVILFDDVMALDVVGPTDVFMAANYYWQKKHGLGREDRFYKYSFVSAGSETVTSLSGLRMAADSTIRQSQPADFDVVLVPGGHGVFDAAQNRDLITWIREAHEHSQRTVSVCSGTLLLAEAGVLDDLTCCSHWTLCAKLARQYPAITVNPEALYIADGKVITSAGVTAGIDMALAIVEEDLGREIALKAARRLVVHIKRPGNQSQFSWPMKAQTAATDEDMGAAVRWILENISTPMSVEDVAEKSGMSLRSFSRHFRTEIGATPAKFIEQARVENARMLLEEHRGVTLAHTAAASGFSSSEHLTRAFERRFGVRPAAYRESFNFN